VKKVFLYGNLGKKFGREWTLNARTVGEAAKAIDANADGFLRYLIQQERKGASYIITTKKVTKIEGPDDFISEENFHQPVSQDEIHICPAVAGGAVFIPIGTAIMKFFGFKGAMTLGAKIAAAAIGMTVMVGATMLIQSIVESLIDMPQMGDPVATKSYVFNGTENVTRQGVPVPIGYGRLLIGSTVIQSGLRSFDTAQAANSGMLESFDQIEIFDMLSEGPIEGIVNRNGETTYDIEQGVYLNRMPVKNMPNAEDGSAEASGTYNYVTNEGGTPIRVSKGNTFERLPLANTVSRKMFPYSEQLIGPNPYSNSILGSLDNAKRHEANVITHYIEDSFSVTATMNLNVQCSYMSKNPDHPIQTNKLVFGVRIYNGLKYMTLDDPGWSIKYRNYEISSKVGAAAPERQKKVNDPATMLVSIEGIATSVYKVEVKVSLPPEEGGGPRWIELVRLTNEVKGNDARNLFSSKLSHVFEEKKYTLTYPNVALANIRFDAKNLSSTPKREFHCKLLKIPIPSNYDPTSREYTGNWNGLFKGQRDELDSIAGIPDNQKYWTNNPAWIFYDLATNARYGLAKYGVGISEDLIDKWSLYKAAKYCDELVETGHSSEKPWRAFRALDKSESGRLLKITIGDDSIYSISQKDFKDEYGNGFSFKGKALVFAVEDEDGRETFHRRTIHSSNANQKWVKVFAPKLRQRQKRETDFNVKGRCVCEFNFPIVEPRFTCNIYINQLYQALDLFKNLSAIFQGMIAYIDGRVGVIQEHPREPLLLFNNSNVSAEGFKYTGVDRSKRKTAVTVRFNNKYNDFATDLAYEEDSTAIDRFGYNEASLVGVGITSPSQAKRMARFYLYVSQFETESVIFTTFLEGMYLKAGDVIEISDVNRQEKFTSGRLREVSPDNRSIVIDKNINKPTVSYYGYEIIINNHQGNETYESIESKSLSAGEDSIDQDVIIDHQSTTQFDRFIGKITTPSTIADLMLKKNFTVDLEGKRFSSYNHGLIKGDYIYFDSEGVLPKPLLKGFAYIVHSVSESGHSFEVAISHNTKVVPSSPGEDQIGNEGGLHYFINTNHSTTTAALRNINLGAAWSVSNNNLIEPLQGNEGYAITAADLNIIMAAKGDKQEITQTGSVTGGSNLITVDDYNEISTGLIAIGEGIPNHSVVEEITAENKVRLSKAATKSASNISITFQTYISSENEDAPDWHYSDKFGHFYASTDSNGWVFTKGMGWVYVSSHAEPVPSGTDGFYYSHDTLGWIWTRYPSDTQDLQNYMHYVDGDKLPELTKKWFAMRYINNQERLKDGIIFVYDSDLLEAQSQRFSIRGCNEGDEIKIKLSYNYTDSDGMPQTVTDDEINLSCTESSFETLKNLQEAFNEYGKQRESEGLFNPFRSSTLSKVGARLRFGPLFSKQWCGVDSSVPVSFKLEDHEGNISFDSANLNDNEFPGFIKVYDDGALYRAGQSIGGFKILKVVPGQGYWLDIANTGTAPDDLTSPISDNSGEPVISTFPNASSDGTINYIGVSEYINYDDKPMPMMGILHGHNLSEEDEVQIYSDHSNMMGSGAYADDYRGFCRVKKIGVNEDGGYDFYLLIGKTITEAVSAFTGNEASGGVYKISGAKISPTQMYSQKFRIKGTKDNGDGSFEVIGSEYNPYKFAAIEKNINIQKPRAYIPPQADMSVPDAPEDLELFDITFRPE